MGGKDAPDGVAPFQSSLQFEKKHFCGCSIISNKWVLTAYIEMLVGTNDLRNGSERYTAERFALHESYDKPRYAYDIALIEVKGTIILNDRVQPIKLSSEEVSEDADLQLTGWGVLAVRKCL